MAWQWASCAQTFWARRPHDARGTPTESIASRRSSRPSSRSARALRTVGQFGRSRRRRAHPAHRHSTAAPALKQPRPRRVTVRCDQHCRWRVARHPRRSRESVPASAQIRAPRTILLPHYRRSHARCYFGISLSTTWAIAPIDPNVCQPGMASANSMLRSSASIGPTVARYVRRALYRSVASANSPACTARRPC